MAIRAFDLSVLKLSSSSDRQEAYEALVLMEDLCREGGDDAKKRFVDHGAFEALEMAGLSGVSLALASEVKESLLKLGDHAPLRLLPKRCLESDSDERGHVKRFQAEAEGSESRRETGQQQPVEDLEHASVAHLQVAVLRSHNRPAWPPTLPEEVAKVRLAVMMELCSSMAGVHHTSSCPGLMKSVYSSSRSALAFAKMGSSAAAAPDPGLPS